MSRRAIFGSLGLLAVFGTAVLASACVRHVDNGGYTYGGRRYGPRGRGGGGGPDN